MSGSRRDSNEPEIVAALTKAGCSIDYVDRKPYDILCGRAGATYALEIKQRKGKLRDSQIKFQAEWKGHYAVVRSVKDALRAVGLIT